MCLFLHHGYKTLQGIILPILEVENQGAKNLKSFIPSTVLNEKKTQPNPNKQLDKTQETPYFLCEEHQQLEKTYLQNH